MRLPAARLRLSPPVVAGALAGACWLIYAAATGDPWLAHSGMNLGLFMVCVVASAAFAVVIIAETVLALIASPSGAATGLQRVLLYAVLSFVGSFVTLSYFGVNLGAVLATSAIVTAAVGLALQPTLGSLISGLTLYSDGVLRVGDTAVTPDGELVVSAMNWRTVVGRRADGATSVVTNAKISDNAFAVFQQGSAGRTAVEFSAGLELSPQAVADLVADMLSDIDEVDAGRPITVLPTRFDAATGLAYYRADFWTRRHEDRATAAALGLARLWYVFQRNGVAMSVATAKPKADPGVLIRQMAAASGFDPRIAEALGKEGALLIFAPGERLVLPDRIVGSKLLLVAGAIKRTDSIIGSLADETGATVDKPRRAAIEEMVEELTLLIGPYAEYVISRASDQAPDITALRQAVAVEIADRAVREVFLSRGRPRPTEMIEPGHLFDAHRDPSGRLSCGPRLRAIDEVTLLAAPARAFEPTGARAARAG